MNKQNMIFIVPANIYFKNMDKDGGKRIGSEKGEIILESKLFKF